MNTTLRLNRMAIFRRSRPLFDEKFHEGINIIHGDNGSGKSTLADFIFFVLGGDLRNWKEHAELAEYVIAEIKVHDALLTLRRDVSKDSGRPMQIFFGGYEEAMTAGPTAWELLPYRRPERGYSFSQVLFKAIGIPEAISDGSSNITMHQLLRLLYVDQMTPIQRIFREENFDTWQTRQALGDLLCGIGGYDLFDLQIGLRDTERKFDAASVELRNLMAVAAGYGEQILPEHISIAIRNLSEERAKSNEDLQKLLAADGELDTEVEDRQKQYKARVRELIRLKRSVAEIEDRVEGLDYEIRDSDLFLQHLRESLEEFEDAAGTFLTLGQIKFEYCPACFSPTASDAVVGHCHLCGSKSPLDEGPSKTLAVRLDLEMQIRESESIQEDRRSELEQLKAALRLDRVRLTRATGELETARGGAPTARESQVSSLSRRIGYIDSELEVLQKRMELAQQIKNISEKKEGFNKRIGQLKTQIEAIIIAQADRKARAYTRASEYTKSFLDKDLEEHSDFGQVNNVTFSFSEDWMAINGDKNRSRSASGMVILKNSFFMGMFLASLKDNKFILPRFMLFDNIEDKGMVQERSWNFQRLIVQALSRETGERQLIFTTSKIAPELAGSQLVVGRKYTREKPSLDFL